MATQAVAAEEARHSSWQRYFPILVIAQFIASLGFGFAQPFMPLFVQELAQSTAGEAALWAGLIAAVNGPIMFVAGPTWGILSDWFGHKRMVLRASFGAGVCMALTGMATDLPQLFVVRAGMGAVSGIWPAINGLSASLAPKSRLPFSVGVLQGANAVGNTLGPVVGGVFVAWLGFSYGFFSSGAILVMAGLLVLFFVREAFHPRAGQRKSVVGVFGDIREMVLLPGMRPVLVLMTLAQFAPNLVMPVIALFVKSLDPAYGAIVIGLVFTVMGLTTAVSAWVTAMVASRFGYKFFLLVGSALVGLGAVVMSVAPDLTIAMASAALMGAGIGIVNTRASALVGEFAPADRQGAAFGIMQSANALGFGFGPLVGGVIAAQWGLRMPFVVEAVTFAIFAVYVVQLRARKAV